MNRKLLWAVLAIGLVLAVAPFALLLPTKASAGEDMLNGFQPIMQPDQVATTARYYNDVFVPLGQVTPMMSAKNLAKFQGYMASRRSSQLSYIREGAQYSRAQPPSFSRSSGTTSSGSG